MVCVCVFLIPTFLMHVYEINGNKLLTLFSKAFSLYCSKSVHGWFMALPHFPHMPSVCFQACEGAHMYVCIHGHTIVLHKCVCVYTYACMCLSSSVPVDLNVCPPALPLSMMVCPQLAVLPCTFEKG